MEMQNMEFNLDKPTTKKVSQKDRKKYITKDSGKRVDFDSGMRRDIQEGKPRFDLCYLPLFKRWAELMERGAIKYGERNWEKANSEKELIRFKASAFRHFIQWIEDEDDEDHAAGTIFNIAAVEMLKEKMNNKTQKGGDEHDRRRTKKSNRR